jgi:hypothetical protein
MLRFETPSLRSQLFRSHIQCNLRPTSPSLAYARADHRLNSVMTARHRASVSRLERCTKGRKRGGVSTSQNSRYISQYCLISLSATIVLYTSFYTTSDTIVWRHFRFHLARAYRTGVRSSIFHFWLGTSLGFPDTYFCTLFHLGNIFVKDTSLDRSAHFPCQLYFVVPGGYPICIWRLHQRRRRRNLDCLG